MISIEESLNNADCFEDLSELVSRTFDGITFWGFRYVESVSNTGRMHIDTFCVRIAEILEVNSVFDKKEEAFQSQRINFILTAIYDCSESRCKKLSIVTRICCRVRDFFNIYRIFSPRPNLGLKDVFPKELEMNVQEKMPYWDFRKAEPGESALPVWDLPDEMLPEDRRVLSEKDEKLLEDNVLATDGFLEITKLPHPMIPEEEKQEQQDIRVPEELSVEEEVAHLLLFSRFEQCRA